MTPLRVRLKEVRQAAEKTQADLARATGLRIATISDIERGKHRGVTLDTLDKLAQALGVAPAELLERVPARRRGK